MTAWEQTRIQYGIQTKMWPKKYSYYGRCKNCCLSECSCFSPDKYFKSVLFIRKMSNSCQMCCFFSMLLFSPDRGKMSGCTVCFVFADSVWLQLCALNSVMVSYTDVVWPACRHLSPIQSSESSDRLPQSLWQHHWCTIHWPVPCLHIHVQGWYLLAYFSKCCRCITTVIKTQWGTGI